GAALRIRSAAAFFAAGTAWLRAGCDSRLSTLGNRPPTGCWKASADLLSANKAATHTNPNVSRPTPFMIFIIFCSFLFERPAWRFLEQVARSLLRRLGHYSCSESTSDRDLPLCPTRRFHFCALA